MLRDYFSLGTCSGRRIIMAYSATIGRWATQDPSGYVDGFNLSQYVLGNPTTYVDPTGFITRIYENAIDVGRYGDVGYFEVFDDGTAEYSVYDPNVPKNQRIEFARHHRDVRGNWVEVVTHNKKNIALPVGKRGRAIARTANGARQHIDDFIALPAGKRNGGPLTRAIKALSVLAIIGLVIQAVQADPCAANPDPVLDVMKKYRRGEVAEVFVKLEMAKYVDDAFRGLPDEVLAAAKLVILRLDLENGN